VTRAGHPSVLARWEAAQRLRLERTRPSTPEGDVAAEHRLYRAIAGSVRAPAGHGVPATVLALRTQVVDAEVARAIGRGTTQMVLVGAGYDGRALRFAGGTARWFEVDRATTLEDKRRQLRALDIEPEGVTPVAFDLLDQRARGAGGAGGETGIGAALDAAGHDATVPSLFVCDGLFDTLTLEAAASLADALRARAAAGSIFVGDFAVAPEGGAPVRALRAATGLVRRAANEPRRSAFRPGDPQKLLVVTGWHVTHTASSVERRVDPGAHTVVLVCEPDNDR
jgi:methyltransferase (TIGR00027 family)